MQDFSCHGSCFSESLLHLFTPFFSGAVVQNRWLQSLSHLSSLALLKWRISGVFDSAHRAIDSVICYSAFVVLPNGCVCDWRQLAKQWDGASQLTEYPILNVGILYLG